jgi:hypothetical protein
VVEQPIRNRQVVGSIPTLGSNLFKELRIQFTLSVARSVQVPSFSLNTSIAETCDSLTLFTYTFIVSPTLECRKIPWMVLSSTPSA